MKKYINEKIVVNGQHLTEQSINNIENSHLFKFIKNYLKYNKNEKVVLYFVYNDFLFFYNNEKLIVKKIKNNNENNENNKNNENNESISTE
jgi:hypothetical protein